MGIFSNIFKKPDEDEDIPFDAYKVQTSQDKSQGVEDSAEGCNKCKNKQDGFCKGKSFRCEAYSPRIDD